MLAAIPTWQEDAAQAAPVQDRAAAEYQAADWGCREAEGQLASAVLQEPPRRAAHEAQAARSDLAVPGLAEDREAGSAGLVRDCHDRETLAAWCQFRSHLR